MKTPNKPLVVFRCDGGDLPETGTGHIRRCLNLAIHLRNSYNIESRFIIRDLNGRPPFVINYKFAVHLLPPVNEWQPLALKIVDRLNPQLVVVDMLDKGDTFLKILKEKLPDIPTLTFDDTDDGIKNASISINGIMEHPAADFSGPDYVILSSGSEAPMIPRREVKEIFLCFGGYDHNHLTKKSIKALCNLNRKIKVTAVVGHSFSYDTSDPNSYSCANILGLDIIRETSNIGYLIKKADIGIVSGGLTLYEALHCGLPTIALNQYRHQTETAENFAKKGATINLGLGSETNIETIAEAVKSLMNNYAQRMALSKQARGLVDGKGLHRIAEIINNALSAKQSFEKFAKDDMKETLAI